MTHAVTTSKGAQPNNNDDAVDAFTLIGLNMTKSNSTTADHLEFLASKNAITDHLKFIDKSLPIGDCGQSDDTDSIVIENGDLDHFTESSNSSSDCEDDDKEGYMKSSSEKHSGRVEHLTYQRDTSPRKQSKIVPHLILRKSISIDDGNTIDDVDKLTQRSRQKALEEYRRKVDASIDSHYAMAGRLFSQGFRILQEARQAEEQERIRRANSQFKKNSN